LKIFKDVLPTEKEAKEMTDNFLKYFTWSEFDSPDQPGSGEKNINIDALKKLIKAREIAGVPFKINSAYRTPGHNAKVGGKPNSAHTHGRAFDVSTRNVNQETVVKAAIKAGFTRIGVYDTFVHMDDDPTLPQWAGWGNYNAFTKFKS
jgi:hypothetical protein